MSTTSAEGIYASSTILPVLSIVAVSLRFYVRSKQRNDLSFDDWAQIPALILYILMGITALIGVTNHAFGHPAPLTDPPDSAPSVILCEKLWFVMQLVQIPALALIKVAALRFYRRIFCPTRAGVLYIAIWILISLVVAWAIGFIVFYVASCGNHPEAAWSGLIEFLDHCRDSETFENSYAISNFLLDTAVLVAPLPSIWSLQTSLGRKIGISGVFMIATVSYGASIARMVTFIKLTSAALGSAPPDTQILDTQAAWFSMLETGLAIIALNMPSLWGLLTSISINSVVPLGNNASPKARKPSDAGSQAVGLVPPHSNAGFSTTVVGERGNDASLADVDVEQGIVVHKSIDQVQAKAGSDDR